MRLTVLVAGSLLIAGMASTVAQAQGRPRASIAAFVETSGVRPGSRTRVALTVELPEGLHVQSDKPRDPALIPTVLSIEAPPGVRISQLVYPHPTDFKQAGQAEPLAVFEHAFVIGAELEIAGSVPAGDLVIPARLRYQACDDKVCFPPTTATTEWSLRVVSSATAITPTAPDVFARLSAGRRTGPPPAAAPQATPSASASPARSDGSGLEKLDGFTVLATAGGYVGRDDFLQFIRDAEQGIASKGLFDGRGPVAILLIILVGGLALNLTPCVLPMIPINLAIIGAGAQAGSRRRGFLLGSTYGAAMALVYGVLGLVVILTASTFGTINASPWFNAGIAALFIVLGLAMFDVVTIDFSRYTSGMHAPDKRGTFAVAFTMGAVAALLAGACVAPVVIQVILFSSSLYAGGTTLALALPFVLGVGMALPWPIAGAGLAALPKPGMWMVRVKQVFGVLILGTAIYYGYLSYTLFANRWVEASEVSGSVQEKLEAGWTSSLAAGLERAQRERKPVLIDFWATWCKNCLTMDKTTLADPAVTAALANYVKIKFQAEDPDAQPAKSLMARFKAIGLPAYVILRPKAVAPTTGTTGTAPAIIPEVRAAIAAGDFARARELVAAYRAEKGVTPEMLEALSWMARGALGAKDLDGAETYARETYKLSTAQLASRTLDEEPRLPIALGAAIEVLGQTDARRGARTEAVAFLRKELAAYSGTSIEKRIRKNLNLLSLEGQPVPEIDLSDYLGPKPSAMAAHKGKVVLMFFWAHWCSDCKAQGPVLAQLANKYRDQGLVIVAPTQRFGYVAGGTPASPEDEARYIEQVSRASYPVLAGQSVPLSEANHLRFGVSTTPTLVLVDRAGIIRLYHPGRLPLEQLEPRIRALLTSS